MSNTQIDNVTVSKDDHSIHNNGLIIGEANTGTNVNINIDSGQTLHPNPPITSRSPVIIAALITACAAIISAIIMVFSN